MEMLVVLLVDATLAGVALLVLLTVIRYQSGVDRESRCRATHTRLAERFRADVHAATGCQALGEPPRGCRLSGPSGRRIEYRLPGDRVARTVYERERLVERDVFALPPGAQAALELPAVAPGVVRLRVTLIGPQWNIEAIVAPRPSLAIEESQP
jgi:hypothetical protein